MKRFVLLMCVMILALSFAACGKNQNKAEREQTETAVLKEDQKMRIRVEGNGNTIIFELNDSQAARDLYGQLPLDMEVENFSTNEKVFYPPQKLNTADTPAAEGGKGTLAYYEPWGDVVMFYGTFETGDSLYGLGKAVSGAGEIVALSGTIKIAAVE